MSRLSLEGAHCHSRSVALLISDPFDWPRRQVSRWLFHPAQLTAQSRVHFRKHPMLKDKMPSKLLWDIGWIHPACQGG